MDLFAGVLLIIGLLAVATGTVGSARRTAGRQDIAIPPGTDLTNPEEVAAAAERQAQKNRTQAPSENWQFVTRTGIGLAATGLAVSIILRL